MVAVVSVGHTCPVVWAAHHGLLADSLVGTCRDHELVDGDAVSTKSCGEVVRIEVSQGRLL